MWEFSVFLNDNPHWPTEGRTLPSLNRVPCTSSLFRGLSLFQVIFVNYLFIREYAETKKCLRDLIDSDSNHPAESKKEFLDLYYSAYNPFCADNRDPGATKNDSCYGVLDVSAAARTAGTPLALGVYNPLCADNWNPKATKNGQCYGVSAAVRTKLSVFLTLMYAFFLFLFLFKA